MRPNSSRPFHSGGARQTTLTILWAILEADLKANLIRNANKVAPKWPAMKVTLRRVNPAASNCPLNRPPPMLRCGNSRPSGRRRRFSYGLRLNLPGAARNRRRTL
jgi:hypothetical protein